MNNEEYFVGLDMGTSSVGWAVTDTSYNVIKRNGKALWGIRLFDEAKTAEERRVFRCARRRLERKKERTQLLQEVFAEEICKVDAGFYQRMNESMYWPEDKRDITGKCPDLPYTLFADDKYTDKTYHLQYPTIFHLRKALINGEKACDDVRLVYLAVHNIIKTEVIFSLKERVLITLRNLVLHGKSYVNY